MVIFLQPFRLSLDSHRVPRLCFFISRESLSLVLEINFISGERVRCLVRLLLRPLFLSGALPNVSNATRRSFSPIRSPIFKAELSNELAIEALCLSNEEVSARWCAVWEACTCCKTKFMLKVPPAGSCGRSTGAWCPIVTKLAASVINCARFWSEWSPIQLLRDADNGYKMIYILCDWDCSGIPLLQYRKAAH